MKIIFLRQNKKKYGSKNKTEWIGEEKMSSLALLISTLKFSIFLMTQSTLDQLASNVIHV